VTVRGDEEVVVVREELRVCELAEDGEREDDDRERERPVE
jgi:hypothetical protein